MTIKRKMKRKTYYVVIRDGKGNERPVCSVKADGMKHVGDKIIFIINEEGQNE